ncbi:hypothetical protein MRB53_041876 [Persea americana]|nr:hypothetical protein MRB53_041876 [Persea americana]
MCSADDIDDSARLAWGAHLVHESMDLALYSSSVPRIRSSSSSSSSSQRSITTLALPPKPCTCSHLAFLCFQCATSCIAADVSYMRGWTWRTRYTTYLGGLGTGIGEGNEGVECGRAAQCFAAREVENEIDCDADEAKRGSRSGPGYLEQEIEGIGGVVKKKVKKRVRVGATVAEGEDERDGGSDCLEAERTGARRSWCSWCSNVVPARHERG